jgi:hypothetical protein
VKKLLLLVVVLLAGCGGPAVAEPAAVPSSAAPSPTPSAYGIGRPAENCTLDGSLAAFGWVVYGYMYGVPEKWAWYSEMDKGIAVINSLTDTDARAVWYCPPS